MRLKFIYLLGMLAFSCSVVDSNKELSYDEAKQKWESLDLTSYTYNYSTLCHCVPSNARVYVERNEVVAVYDMRSNKSINFDQQHYHTIDELFTKMKEWEDSRTVRAEFDARTGMPIEIAIDEEKLPFDAGVILSFSWLEPIK